LVEVVEIKGIGEQGQLIYNEILRDLSETLGRVRAVAFLELARSSSADFGRTGQKISLRRHRDSNAGGYGVLTVEGGGLPYSISVTDEIRERYIGILTFPTEL